MFPTGDSAGREGTVNNMPAGFRLQFLQSRLKKRSVSTGSADRTPKFCQASGNPLLPPYLCGRKFLSMISRRNIRVKVMQTLYAQSSLDSANPLSNSVAHLQKHYEQTRQLLVFLLWTLTEIGRQVEKHALQKASKHLPTEADLQINTKLAGNEILWEIQQDTTLADHLKKDQVARHGMENLIKEIHAHLLESITYQQYIAQPSRTRSEEKKMLLQILNDQMIEFEPYVEWLEYHFTNWEDDAEAILQLLTQYLQKPGKLSGQKEGVSFQQLIPADKWNFGKELLTTVIEKNEHLLSLIVPKLKNWDPERIASLDMILMKMGLAELLYFETIPPKVTLNEYIDLAKEYSTAQSGQFVNGILDNIHKELAEAGQLKKIEFRKS
jgi:N utilization substance protein B